jgi:hypothetical protein
MFKSIPDLRRGDSYPEGHLESPLRWSGMISINHFAWYEHLDKLDELDDLDELDNLL